MTAIFLDIDGVLNNLYTTVTIPGRKIEMIATQEYTMMIGVPSAEQAAMWKTILSLTS